MRGNKLKELLIYLTSDCQLQCKHCFVLKENPIKELPLQNIEWLVKTFDIRNVNFLGGEPLLYPHLREAVGAFDKKTKITISTNGLAIAKNDSRAREILDILKSKGENISVQLSIQGNQDDTDDIRGAGVWNKVLSVADILKKNDIKCFFICNYSSNNLDHIPEVIDSVAHPRHMPLALFPEIGKPALTAKEQSWLFTMIVQKNDQYNGNNVVDLPNFYQWLGLPGRCGAGAERLCVTYNGEFVPCHFDLQYILGRVGDKLEIINRNREFFLKNAKRIKSGCGFCKNAEICRGGCYIAGAHRGCPLRKDYTLERYAVASNIGEDALSAQISNIRGLLKDSLICG